MERKSRNNVMSSMPNGPGAAHPLPPRPLPFCLCSPSPPLRFPTGKRKHHADGTCTMYVASGLGLSAADVVAEKAALVLWPALWHW